MGKTISFRQYLLLNASSLLTCNVDGKTIFTTPVALMFSIIVIPSGMTISSASDNLFNFLKIVSSIMNFVFKRKIGGFTCFQTRDGYPCPWWVYKPSAL